MTEPNPLPGDRHLIKACPVCNGPRSYYLFSSSVYRVVRCQDCGLVFLNPQPSDNELRRISSEQYSRGSNSEAERAAVSNMKRATASLYLSKISRYSPTSAGRLLEIGCGDGDLLVTAEAEGWRVTGVEYSSSACERAQSRLKAGVVIHGELRHANLRPDEFDLCILSGVIDRVRSPLDFMREVHRVLKPGGTVMIATPSIDSWPARLMKQNWMEFKAEHLTYFDRQTLQTLLAKAGFRELIVEPAREVLSFDYIRLYLERFPVDLVTPVVQFLAHLLPERIRLKHRHMVASGIMVFSRKHRPTPIPVLSVIVPLFNEARTFESLMSALLLKELPGLELELIIVESNSTDGSRELAQRFGHHPRVKLIRQDSARGKGFAVRAGLCVATGDYVLIQDADLEYDLEDYDALLEPLVAGRCAFVLGSRHGGRNVWKMRQFTGQFGLSMFVNFGHWIFATLINLLFLKRLRDPFSMFKVFRRDCLFGLDFRCDRFDFDFELLVKLIRKGYSPIELPVNYRSRSFAEGKKVKLLRDPLNWLMALVWLRFVKVEPMKVAERLHRDELRHLDTTSATTMDQRSERQSKSILPI